MSLFVKCLTGRVIIITIHENMTILNVKEQIQMHDGIDISQIKIICEGKLLNDTLKVDESFDKKTIHMILALRGG
jgi:hypothetical protein